MFADSVLDKIFSRPELHKISIEHQSAIVNVIEKALEDVLEENPHFIPTTRRCRIKIRILTSQ